jgi:hypothetical protein
VKWDDDIESLTATAVEIHGEDVVSDVIRRVCMETRRRLASEVERGASGGLNPTEFEKALRHELRRLVRPQ